MTPSEKRSLKIGGVVLILILLVLMPEMIGGWIGIAFTALFGWASFLLRVVPQIRIRWGAVGSAGVYVALLLAGAHYFLRWLYREMRSSAAPPVWRWRWTVGGLLLIVVMFTSGMAAIGAAHQTAWLVTSPEPLLKPYGREMTYRMVCNSNLKQIGQALILYANDHERKYPNDLSALLEEELTAAVFVCPSSNDESATGATTQAVAANLATPHHCSYIYLGTGLSQPIDPDRVIVLEPLENHQRAGINVLFGDGHTEWFDKGKAEALLAKLGIAGPATQPVSPAAKPHTTP